MKKSIFIKSMALGLGVMLFSNSAKAIPIPAIDVGNLPTFVTQIQQYVKEWKEQIEQNLTAAKQLTSMGNLGSLDAIVGKLKDKFPSVINLPKMPKDAEKVGLKEETMKDPEQASKAIDKLQSDSLKSKGVDEQIEFTNKCSAAKAALKRELAKNGLASGWAAQVAAGDGKQVEQAKDASDNTNDQMQLLISNTMMHKSIFEQLNQMTAIQANKLASSAVGSICN
ncbi:MAG: hypothetical protein MJ247_04415 [Alphaproteobacteria bacterium]|nr:hypothetical protein [Alphaproteobacteria bacterium]